jgi:hypothetical protein
MSATKAGAEKTLQLQITFKLTNEEQGGLPTDEFLLRHSLTRSDITALDIISLTASEE